MKITPSTGAVFLDVSTFYSETLATQDPGPHKYTWNHMVQKTRTALSLAMRLFCILKLDTLGKDFFHLVLGFSMVFSRLVSPSYGYIRCLCRHQGFPVHLSRRPGRAWKQAGSCSYGPTVNAMGSC